MASTALAEWPSKKLSAVAISITSGTTTRRKRDAQFPLYGSTGQIGRTDTAEFDGPSILVARVGANAGTVYQVDGRYGVSDNTLVVRLGPNHDVKFFAEVLKRLNLNTMVYGSGQPLVTGSMLKALDVPDITPEEQLRISTILSDADKHIDSLERLITKKHEIKQGTAQQLLTGTTRLPGFSDGWESVYLGDVGRCIRGVAYDPREDLSDRDETFTARLFRSNNVQSGNISLRSLQFVHKRRVNPDQFMRSDDILICMANGSKELVGKSAFFEKNDTTHVYTFGAFMGVFRTNPDIADPRFVGHMLHSKAFRNMIDVALAGSSINNLRPRDIESFATAVPSKTEQQRIAHVLGDIDMELRKLGEQLHKARMMKQGIVQELLTGRTRLRHIEVMA